MKESRPTILRWASAAVFALLMGGYLAAEALVRLSDLVREKVRGRK